MKKNELKKILKPLIKECIKEVIFEEGALSTIISEVMKGTSGSQRIVETEQPKQNFADRDRKLKEAKERKRKLLDSIGRSSYNGVDLFENTTPMSSHEAAAPKAGSVDLGNPGDSGVDISALMGGASKIWQAMK